MGRFVDAVIDELSDSEIEDLERLLQLPDAEFYHYVVTRQAPPAPYDRPVFWRLCAFHHERVPEGARP